MNDIPLTASHLATLIERKTIAFRERNLVDEKEFEGFYSDLACLYPLVHERLALMRIGPAGLLYHWKGEKNDNPVILMSHLDVVPADEGKWEKPPFAGIIEDGFVWGRGSLDTKATLVGIMDACERLLAKGFKPSRDIYFAFGGDEEVHGESAKAIVAWLQEKKIRPALVLDEGGTVTVGIVPGVEKPCALIGIGEKGVLDVELRLDTSGGHASSPPPHTAVGRLARAAARIESHPFPAKLTKPVAEMFHALSPYAGPGYRLVYKHIRLFSPILRLLGRMNGGMLNALIRTTCALTRMEGSPAYNVLPTQASLGLNMRLLENTSIETALARLKKTVADNDIEISAISGDNPSRISTTDCAEYEILVATIAKLFPDAATAPYLMTMATDSRHYGALCDRVYRFSPLTLTEEQLALIHGHNERISIDSLEKVAGFYEELMRAV